MPVLIKSIIQSENQFHMSYADIRICETCQAPVQVSDRWLLETPNVYTFSLQYDPSQQATSRELLTKVYEMLLPSTINLRDFLKVGEQGHQTPAASPKATPT